MISTTIGTKIKPLGINRLTVADGCVARVILIDPNPQYKFIAFDEDLKRRVEVDQDLMIKYNLRASATFYYLVARLNCDMKGNVVSDDVVVEYLQLSQNLQNEFCDAVEENPNFNSLKLTKVSKKGDGGKDFSYVKVIPSNYKVSDEILSKVEQIRQTPQAVDSMWKLIDRSTSITADEYIALKEGNGAPAAAQVAAPAARPQLSAPARPEPQMPTASDNFAKENDFGGDEDFGF